jgi:hypothetical protein
MTRYPDMLVSSFPPPAVKIHCSCVSVSVSQSVSVSLTRTACREPKRRRRGTRRQTRRTGTPRRNKISRGRSHGAHSVSVHLNNLYNGIPACSANRQDSSCFREEKRGRARGPSRTQRIRSSRDSSVLELPL